MSDLRPALPSYTCWPALFLLAVIPLALGLYELLAPPVPLEVKPTRGATTDVASSPHPMLTSLAITIVPPTYTGLPTRQTNEPNLSLVAGSTVTWRLDVSKGTQQQGLAINLPNEQRIGLTRQSGHNFQGSATVDQTGVYHFTAGDTILSEVHTLAVSADTRPTIRFIAPIDTITELAKDAPARFETVVSVVDDFGLDGVEILASIASGSGEAVKFRDQTFQFDSSSLVEGQSRYIKNWDLRELGMQPGDELYFSVRAWDNRQPVKQQSRSASKIVRWLEDEQQTLMADGVLPTFIPEYFKSQRQIIIETQQLISDKTLLSPQEFIQTSRQLGTAQSLLKQKYGQFLGDEFDSGTPHTMEAGPELDHHDHADQVSSSASAAPHQAEAHAQEPSQDGEDKSGYQAIIAQFGHAHGEADDGNFIKQGLPSPRVLMKRALGKMWQAELHLLLCEPELALPFENQALELLNRAKKADRIYVKRLGFEPPPVSEKRRYQGDLSDIVNYQRSEQLSNPDTDMQKVKAMVKTLTHYLNAPHTLPLTDAEKSTLKTVNGFIAQRLTSHPDDIKFVAILEKIQLADSYNLPNCKGCISQLRNKLWQSLPKPIAVTTRRTLPYSPANPLLNNYQEFLQQTRQEQQE